MSQTINPFAPMGSSVNTTHKQATTSSGVVAISPAPAASDVQGRNVRIVASAACFVALGTSSLVVEIPSAGTPKNGIYLPAGAPGLILPIGPSDTHVGMITSASTAEVYITRGDAS